jgi:hypothetical protein
MLFEDFPVERDLGKVVIMYFSQEDVDYWTRFWNGLNVKYHNNPFFSKIWKKFSQSKSITKGQWVELKFLLENGKSRYEAGVLGPNY